MSNHTPGPWTVIELGEENALVSIADGCTVGGVYTGGDTDRLSPADARLIAAAPDLLAAARLAVLNFKRQNLSTANADFLGDDDHEAWNALGQAIAKVEGKA